ncbi:MAG: tetratricopeptide repeat protein, partial [Myxococcota bacterium]|nr:tetratricopeptide repeat protein [Myxococcota bacterium]
VSPRPPGAAPVRAGGAFRSAPAAPAQPPVAEEPLEEFDPDDSGIVTVEDSQRFDAPGGGDLDPVVAPDVTTGRIPDVPHVVAEPQVLPPLPDESPGVDKLVTEADVFAKFGLRDRAIGHLVGGLAKFPASVRLREKLVALHLASSDIPSAVQIMLDMAEILAPTHPGHAIRSLREVLVLDEDNATALERLDALLHPAAAARRPASERFAAVEHRGMADPVPMLRPSPETEPEIEFDVDLASEPVMTVTVPPPSSASPLPSPLPAAAAAREPAQVLDLPAFDDVETGPPFMALTADQGWRVATPLGGEALTVLEIEDEDSDWILPAGPAEPPAASAPARALSPTEDAVLVQAIEEIDFFHQQGLDEDARTLVEQLAAEHGDDRRVRDLYRQLVGRDPVGRARPAAAPAPAGGNEMADVLLALDAIINEDAAGVQNGAPPAPARDAADPAEATMHYDLGVAYREMGVLDRAIDEFRLAAADPVREANCYAMIGSCLTALGRPKEAIEQIKRGLHARGKSGTDETELLYELGCACQADNDHKEALFYLQKVKKMDPAYRDVQQRIAALTVAGRPGRKPSPRAATGTPQDRALDGASVDQAFDDLFKDGGT